MSHARPQAVLMAAATVGGIFANSSYPGDFLYDNLMIAANVIETSRQVGVEKLMFLGSSCMYPKFAPQPIREEMLLSGPLEPTNESYALAKIAGLKLCAAYRRPVWLRFHICAADQSLRAGQQFSSRAWPRACRINPGGSMRQKLRDVLPSLYGGQEHRAVSFYSLTILPTPACL